MPSNFDINPLVRAEIVLCAQTMVGLCPDQGTGLRLITGMCPDCDQWHMRLVGGVGTPYEDNVYYQFPIGIPSQASAEQFGHTFMREVLKLLPGEAVRSAVFASRLGDASSN